MGTKGTTNYRIYDQNALYFTTLAPVTENPEGYLYSSAKYYSDMDVLMDIDFL